MSDDDQLGREEEDQHTPLHGGGDIPFPEENDDSYEEEAVTKVRRCWCSSLQPRKVHGLR